VQGQATERMGRLFSGRRRRLARGHAIGLLAVALAAAGQGSMFAVEFPCSPARAAPASGSVYSQADPSVGSEEALNEPIDVLLGDIERPGTGGRQMIRTGNPPRASRAGLPPHPAIPVQRAELVAVVASLAARRT
jgi:hypothetical protein